MSFREMKVSYSLLHGAAAALANPHCAGLETQICPWSAAKAIHPPAPDWLEGDGWVYGGRTSLNALSHETAPAVVALPCQLPIFAFATSPIFDVFG